MFFTRASFLLWLCIYVFDLFAAFSFAVTLRDFPACLLLQCFYVCDMFGASFQFCCEFW